MSESPPGLHMLNLVVGDMAASIDFYRRLGIAVPHEENAAGPHVQLRMPGGFSLELDTAESARLWHAGWRADPAGGGVVIGFSLPAREAVDERLGKAGPRLSPGVAVTFGCGAASAVPQGCTRRAARVHVSWRAVDPHAP